MSFTDEEIARWHRGSQLAVDQIESRSRKEADLARRTHAIAVCINCGNPFGVTGGVITENVDMC
jgi:hypothetical protein